VDSSTANGNGPQAAGAPFTVGLDDAGLLRLTWARDLDITQPLAEYAMAAVDELCGDDRHPMLVDMATTASVTRQARGVFAKPCAASAIALLGASPVDRVIANFVLGVSSLPCPTKYFTSEPAALRWLGDVRD